MLYVHNPETNALDIYDQPGADITSTAHCPAPCCDIACESCAAEALCGHSEHGLGGMCVFRHVEDGEFECLAYYPQGVSYTQCGCIDPYQCSHAEILKVEVRRRQPGSRPAGVQKARFLAAQKGEGE